MRDKLLAYLTDPQVRVQSEALNLNARAQTVALNPSATLELGKPEKIETLIDTLYRYIQALRRSCTTLAIVGRFDANSGFDILAESLTPILERGVQLVLMGPGPSEIIERLQSSSRQPPLATKGQKELEERPGRAGTVWKGQVI